MGFEILTAYILPFMFVLTTIVFFHELGHYLVARYHGVRIEAFSIGFGPEVFGWTDSHGTRWKFCALPLGGYVKMFSDANAASVPDTAAISQMSEEDKKGSLAHKSVGARMQVSAAGPLANFLFSLIVLAASYSIFGQQVPASTAKIGMVLHGGPADAAGLQVGDVVVGINGRPVVNFMDLITQLNDSQGEMSLAYERAGARHDVQINPERQGARALIGVGPGADKMQRGFFESWVYAAQDTYHLAIMTAKGIGQMLLGQRSAEGLSGPIGIAKMTGEVAAGGMEALIWFMAFLSINLGVLNLFPIPVLDGGHLMFYLIEAITGRPVSEKAQEYAFRLGFLLFMGVFAFTTFKDVGSLGIVQKLMQKLGW